MVSISAPGLTEDRGGVAGSEVAWVFALFAAVQGGMIEEGAGPAAPLSLVLLCGGFQAHAALRKSTFRWNRSNKSKIVIKILDCTGIEVLPFCLKQVDFFGETIYVDLQ